MLYFAVPALVIVPLGPFAVDDDGCIAPGLVSKYWRACESGQRQVDQIGNSRQYINPDVVPLPAWGSELHLPEWRRYHDAVLVETRREWVRIEDRANTFDVRCTDTTSAHRRPGIGEAPTAFGTGLGNV